MDLELPVTFTLIILCSIEIGNTWTTVLNEQKSLTILCLGRLLGVLSLPKTSLLKATVAWVHRFSLLWMRRTKGILLDAFLPVPCRSLVVGGFVEQDVIFRFIIWERDAPFLFAATILMPCPSGLVLDLHYYFPVSYHSTLSAFP